MTDHATTGPIPSSERIASIDVLRGFALLGIFVMNVQSMSMIGAAYFNPTSFGDLTGLNHLVWYLSHLLADQKFMAIFSILFGAGIVLFANRAEAKGCRPAGLHYRRTFWLIVFGLLHAYLIWYGDILFAYGICALVVYLFRRLPPAWLFGLGLFTLACGSGLYLFSGWSIPYWPAEQLAGVAEGLWRPGAAQIASELEAYRGGFRAQMSQRWIASLEMQTRSFFFWTSWRAGGLMLVGMALFKWRILSAQRSKRFYAVMALVGFALGLPLVAFGAAAHAAHGWDFKYSFFLGSQYNYWGSLLVAAGYIGSLMFALRAWPALRAWGPLSAVGRTAFTNYILQSVLGTFLFYGHGLGLFGQVERQGQAVVVVGFWLLQLVASTLWLRRFRFGPLEWAWRSLSYWRIA